MTGGCGHVFRSKGARHDLQTTSPELGHVALTMFTFGIGSALPLLLLGMLSRKSLLRWRGRMLSFGKGGKAVLAGEERRHHDPQVDRAGAGSRGRLLVNQPLQR